MNNLIKSIETDIENAINIFCKNISKKYELDSVDLMTIWNTQNNIDAPQVNKTSKTNTKKTEKKVEKNLDQKTIVDVLHFLHHNFHQLMF